MTWRLLLWVFVVFMPSLSWAETSLWRVSKGQQQLLIGGTVHLLSQSDYPLPDEFEQAIREIDTLVLETNMDAFATPQNQANLLHSLQYQDGSTLKQHIKPKTYRALVRYCKLSHLDIATLQNMKPSLVVLTLTVAQLQRLQMADVGVDTLFHQKAKAQGKKITGLESAATQMTALDSLGTGQEDEVILSTIKELNTTKDYIDDLKQAWRKGNLATIEKIGLSAMQADSPELNRQLLTERNQQWLPKITAMLSSPERELILVGVLHLVGKDGLLALLQRQGYLVERY